MSKKILKGIIVSNKMKKTVVVEVETIKKHAKLRKRYKVHKKYKAHDEKQQYKPGNMVIIGECKPLSKDKRWRVLKILNPKS